MAYVIETSSSDVGQISQIENCKEKKKLVFGWKCITSKHIQCFNKPIVFLIILCIAAFVQGMISTGYNASAVTSIEKEFGLSSTQISTFKIVYYAVGGIGSLFIGYLCSTHKPRFIALGIVLLSLGSFIICLPKLMIGSYKPIDHDNGYICSTNISSRIDRGGGEIKSSETSSYQLTFIIGYFLFGIGVIPIDTIARSHIDEIFNREQASKYLGVFMAINLLGMTAGFVVATPILRIWVDIYGAPNIYSISNPNWIGAWWIGYLATGFLLLLVVIPMLGFPSEFADTRAITIKKRDLPDTIADDGQITSWWTSLKSLLTNKLLIFITLGHTFEQMVTTGFALFVAKYHETQFHFSASSAAIFSGVPPIIGGVAGTLFSGLIIKRYSLNCKQIIRYGTIAALLATLFSPVMLVPCNVSASKVISSAPQNMECNKNCNCTPEYHPICTADRESFYSPCYAGCSVENQVNNTFYNCSCFSHNSTFAKDGRCTPGDCSLFPLFFIGMIILNFFVVVNEVPFVNISLRVVNEGQGSAAMGFQKMFAVLLGALPSPAIYGVFVDKSCILWASKESSGKNNCLEYDTNLFRYYFFGIIIILNFLGFCCLMIADKLYELPNEANETSQGIGMNNIGYSIEE